MGAETRGDDDIEKNPQKMIPDGWIGRFLLDAPFNSFVWGWVRLVGNCVGKTGSAVRTAALIFLVLKLLGQ